jgi:murein L,D-transpeptidase YcbB/YkuD
LIACIVQRTVAVHPDFKRGARLRGETAFVHLLYTNLSRKPFPKMCSFRAPNVVTGARQRPRACAKVLAAGGLALALLACAHLSPGIAAEVEGARDARDEAVAQSQADARAQALERSLATAPDGLPAGVALGTLRAFYAARDHRPVWLAWHAGPAEALLQAIEDSARDGLRPADYRVEALRAALAEAETPAAEAELELALSAQFLHYVRDLRQGRVRPGKVDSNLPAPAQAPDAARLLDAAARSEDVAAFLDAQAPASPVYRRLRRALADYRAIEADGGWPDVGPGETLKPGMTGADVAAVRARLRASGDLTIASAQPEVFDDQLELAVRRFQRRHGLEVDGLVGKNTRRELDVPVATRIAQIKVNMERWRWMPDDLGRRYVLVNLAGFEVELVEAGSLQLAMNAVVGKPFRMTPVFSDEITYLEFNPDWTIPPTILREDVLPKLREDPGYLAANEMTLYAGWSAAAAKLDPAEIDWQTVQPKRFPYKIVQRPGPANPLGRVKFMFPNAHHIYLHDSPARELFGRASRAFSSGCIRVEKPFELAEALLAGTPDWDRAKIDRVVAGRTTRKVRLPESVPVHLTYSTAWIGEGGTVHFRPDVYGRDRALADALAERPKP